MGTYGQTFWDACSTAPTACSRGKTAQMVDLGTSILPPNAANLLVTKDGADYLAPAASCASVWRRRRRRRVSVYESAPPSRGAYGTYQYISTRAIPRTGRTRRRELRPRRRQPAENSTARARARRPTPSAAEQRLVRDDGAACAVRDERAGHERLVDLRRAARELLDLWLSARARRRHAARPRRAGPRNIRHAAVGEVVHREQQLVDEARRPATSGSRPAVLRGRKQVVDQLALRPRPATAPGRPSRNGGSNRPAGCRRRRARGRPPPAVSGGEPPLAPPNCLGRQGVGHAAPTPRALAATVEAERGLQQSIVEPGAPRKVGQEQTDGGCERTMLTSCSRPNKAERELERLPTRESIYW